MHPIADHQNLNTSAIHDGSIDGLGGIYSISAMGARSWDTVTAVLLRLRTAGSMPPLMHHPAHYKMWAWEDLSSWVIFLAVFCVLVFFDNVILHGKNQKLGFKRAALYSCFWISCASAFCCYIYYSRGPTAAFDWSTGYLLEWMLSVDNLFVFRSIFQLFKTPGVQKHKPLFWGIVGAVVFRMAFFVVEQLLVQTFAWMHYVLGCFLIYTGLKVVLLEDDEDGSHSPNESQIFVKITQQLHFVDSYAPEPKFLARVAVDSQTKEPVLPDWTPPRLPKDYDPARTGGDPTKGRDIILEYRLTRLFLVVLCLELTDIVFAVDSVSAIVAQIPDLYLAYTACVFAMLGLRAMFFVVDELVQLFTLLPYAVAMILVFLGSKLILKHWIHIPPEIVCCILVFTVATSMIASIIYDRFLKKGAEEEEKASEGSELKDSEDDDTEAGLEASPKSAGGLFAYPGAEKKDDDLIKPLAPEPEKPETSHPAEEEAVHHEHP